jgi:hypothetical protein
VTVFTQAPDGALQDVEVFAQSACIDERRQQHGALAFAELWAVHRHDGMQPSHPAICDEYLMPKYPVRSPPKAGLNRIARAAGEKEAI